MNPYVGHINPHFAEIADCTAGIGNIQPLGDVERRPLPAADQHRKDPKFIVVEIKFLTFVQDLIECPCVLALSTGGVLFLVHTSGLFTIGALGDTQSSSTPLVLRTNGARFDPRKKLLFREHRAASELLVRDRVFVDEIVKRGPGGGYALLSQEPGGIFDVHAVGLDGLILAPEVGEFGKDRVNRIANDGLQLRGRCYNYGVVHNIVKFLKLNTCPGRGHW